MLEHPFDMWGCKDDGFPLGNSQALVFLKPIVLVCATGFQALQERWWFQAHECPRVWVVGDVFSLHGVGIRSLLKNVGASF